MKRPRKGTRREAAEVVGALARTVGLDRAGELLGKQRRGQVPIKLSREEHDLLRQAAASQDLPLGTWIRQVCLAEARRVLGEPARGR